MLNTDLIDALRPLGIAVSGGSDSTALLVLLHAYLGPAQVRAVTINHGLRSGVDQEITQVAKLCAKLGIAHDVVRVSVDPSRDIQARARKARYAALAGWGAEHGLAAVALGHTRDDVAETFLMRLARGSGVDGLAQMEERFVRDGVTFLRPVLGATRDALRDLLRTRDIGWSEDPSNVDPRFARARIRVAWPQIEEVGLSTERLAQSAQWMRSAHVVLEQAADVWIADNARGEQGDAVLHMPALVTAPDETAARVITRALCAISAIAYRPRLSALVQLRAATQAGKSATLHGCLAYLQGDELRITRELNAVQAQGSPWDGRWKVAGPFAPEMQILPLGESGLSQLENWRDTALLPRRSLLASPSVWQGDTLVAAPLARPDARWSASAPNPLHLPE